MNRGFTLLELLIVLALATGLGLIALPLPVQHRDRLVLQQAMRRLRLGLDRGRLAAERSGQPCALHLSQPGWEAPAIGALPPCRGAPMPLIPAAGAEPPQVWTRELPSDRSSPGNCPHRHVSR